MSGDANMGKEGLQMLAAITGADTVDTFLGNPGGKGTLSSLMDQGVSSGGGGFGAPSGFGGGEAPEPRPMGGFGSGTAPSPGGSSPFGPPTGGEDKPGFIDAFFGSLDKNLNSPARLLGIGLLNQGRRPIGTYGLLGKGLYDAFTRNRA